MTNVLLHQINELNAAKLLLQKQESILRAEVMLWWQDVFASYGEEIIKLLMRHPDGYNQKPHPEEILAPSEVAFIGAQRHKDHAWRDYRLYYSEIGAAIDCTLSIVDGRAVGTNCFWLRGIVLIREAELSEEDASVKNLVAEVLKKEEARNEELKRHDQKVQKWFKGYMDKNMQEVVRKMNGAAGLAPSYPKLTDEDVQLSLHTMNSDGDRFFILHFPALGLDVTVKTKNRWSGVRVLVLVPADIDPVCTWAPHKLGK